MILDVLLIAGPLLILACWLWWSSPARRDQRDDRKARARYEALQDEEWEAGKATEDQAEYTTRPIPLPAPVQVSDDTAPMDPPLRPLPPSLTHDPLHRPPRQHGRVIVNPETTPLFDGLVRDVSEWGIRVQVAGLPLATKWWGVRDRRGGHYCARARKKEIEA